MNEAKTSKPRPSLAVATGTLAAAVSALALACGPDLVFARIAVNHNETAATDPPA